MPTNKLEIYRGESLHLTVDIDERTQFSHTLNAEHKITAVFVSSERLDLQVDDYIMHKGEAYYMNLPPSYRKQAKITYIYTCQFEHIFYKTHDKMFMHLGAADFPFFGDATAHMQLVVDNLNEITPGGWSLGPMAATDQRLIKYVNNERGFSCRNAISLIAETFQLEIDYDGQQIGLVERVGVNTNISFEYGRGDGLYALERITPDNFHPANKLYVFGGKTNIPFDYRGGTKRLVFADRFVTRPLEPGEPVREGVRFYDDIFPERTSSFETVASDGLLLTDSAIDFDINDHLIAGVTAMVVFKSGDLMGNEFEIESYDHTTQTIKIIPYADENGYILPNTLVQPRGGDLYTLTGVALPQTYIDAAETRLKQKADADISEPIRLPYAIEIDEKFMRDNGLSLNVGDRVLIKDDELGIDDTIRMSSISYPLVNEYKLSAEISDRVLYTKLDRVIQDQKKENDAVVRKQTQDYDAIRRNMLRFKQLNDLVFDPGGYFDPERIKPFSIETYLLSVGAQSQNFGLNGVTISTNHLGDENTMVISAGDLVHYTLEIEGLGYIWSIPQSTFSGLDPAKSYYVYARCSRTVLTGEWMVSETPVLAEDPLYPGMWNFNLGILFDVKEGRRDFEFTKGMTFIVGDTIKTGRVQSHNGESYLDLDTGQVKIGTATGGLDWNVTVTNTLTIRGAIVQNAGGATSHIGLFRGPWQLGVVYYPGDEVTYDGSTYRYVGTTPSNTAPPPSASVWQVLAAKGSAGEDGTDGTDGAPANYTELRYQENGSPTSPPPVATTNPTPPGWSITQPSYDPLKYVWMISALKSGVDGSLITNWPAVPTRVTGVEGPAGPAGPAGADGADGSDGKRGPGIVFRGGYDNAETYYGNDQRIDIVYYSGLYYAARVDMPGGQSTGVLPTDTGYWNGFGAQFDSVATGLLLAEYAVVTNLGAQYIQTAIAGNKRIEVNERRERKNADGSGTGLWVDQNNVALFAANNTKLAEIDDDSSPGLGVFYLEFPSTNNPTFSRFRGDMRERNWSQYNSGSFDSRTGNEGDFTNGFPRFVLDLISQTLSGGTRVRYYFRHSTQGFNASDPNTDTDLLANASVGTDVSNLRNVNVIGAFGTGGTKIIGTEPFDNQLDAGFLNYLDHTIIYKDVSAGTFSIPVFMTGSVGAGYLINHSALNYTQIGRELVFVNKSTSTLTINQSGSSDIGQFIIGWSTDSFSVVVQGRTTVKLKLISRSGIPTDISKWRWVVVEISSN